MGDSKTRTSRLKSPEYRVFLGKILREKRQEQGYSLSDIYDMTGIPTNTVLSIEKGITTSIDYYVEYAKAVEYDFDSLTSAGIELKPSKELPDNKKERVFLTKKIRTYLIKTGFLDNGKTNEEIRDELARLKQIEKEETSSIDVAGVMRNLVEDETVKIIEKTGGKNKYALV